jgi:hypothetical protein
VTSSLLRVRTQQQPTPLRVRALDQRRALRGLPVEGEDSATTDAEDEDATMANADLLQPSPPRSASPRSAATSSPLRVRTGTTSDREPAVRCHPDLQARPPAPTRSCATRATAQTPPCVHPGLPIASAAIPIFSPTHAHTILCYAQRGFKLMQCARGGM